MNNELSDFAKSILNDTPLATNVIITESLYPYITPDINTVTKNGISIDRNISYDPITNTIKINVGDLVPRQTIDVAFNAKINLDLPVDVTNASADKIFRRGSIPSSISYRWLNNTDVVDSLPENSIEINSSRNRDSDKKTIEFEFGILTLFVLLFTIFLKRNRKI